MVRVLCKKVSGDYRDFLFEGHAGGKFAIFGIDEVCAGVSVLFINTFNSIEEFTKDRPKSQIQRKGKSQRIHVSFSEKYGEETKLLLDSMIFGLKQIEKQYGKKYISLTIEEV